MLVWLLMVGCWWLVVILVLCICVWCVFMIWLVMCGRSCWVWVCFEVGIVLLCWVIGCMWWGVVSWGCVGSVWMCCWWSVIVLFWVNGVLWCCCWWVWVWWVFWCCMGVFICWVVGMRVRRSIRSVFSVLVLSLMSGWRMMSCLRLLWVCFVVFFLCLIVWFGNFELVWCFWC